MARSTESQEARRLILCEEGDHSHCSVRNCIYRHDEEYYGIAIRADVLDSLPY